MLLICDETSKSLVNSITFALIGARTHSFASFTFAPMEAPHYVYMLFHFLLHSHAPYRVSGILALGLMINRLVVIATV